MKAFALVLLLAISAGAQSRHNVAAKPSGKSQPASAKTQAAATPSATPQPTPQPTPQEEGWGAWFLGQGIDWGVGKILSLLLFVLIWPIYKAGFFVRQGWVYHKELRQVDNKLARGAALTPEGQKIYDQTAKKRRLMLVGAPVFILVIAVVLIALTTWKVSLVSFGLALCGFINVND